MDYESTVRKYFVNLNSAANMVGNVPVANLENYYNILNEVQLSRLITTHPYLNALFMSNAANAMNAASASSVTSSVNAGSNTASSSRSSENTNVTSRSTNSATSPLSVGASTGVNRRNVTMNAAEDLHEVELDGHKTPSVIVGGEPRIPLNFVEFLLYPTVKQVTVKDTLAEHNIRPVDCTENEFSVLRPKLRGSGNIKKVQLLSYSLAEFLIRTLLHEKGKVISRSDAVEVRPGVRVKARVFGKQRGFFRSDLYTSPSAQCIECDTCGTYFSPDKFVGHTHQPEMMGVVHWGYKPSEWRRYLYLFRDKKSEEMSNDERQMETFNEMLNRFNSRLSSPYKRKQLISQTPKLIDSNRKRSHVKHEQNDGDFPPNKRVLSRDLIAEVTKPHDNPDALYAPNVNLGSLPSEGKSAFTPIERKDVKEIVAGFSKEDAMMDRLKKQYQLIKDGVENLPIPNSEKQTMLVEWANLNQGHASLYNSMRNRIIAHKQAEHHISSSISSLSSEMDSIRTENLDLKSQMRSVNEENEALRKKLLSQRESGPMKDRILYQTAKEDLENNRIQLSRQEELNQRLMAKNAQLEAENSRLRCGRSFSECMSDRKSYTEETGDNVDDLHNSDQSSLPLPEVEPYRVKLENEIEIDVDSDDVDSAATESAPGNSEPGSPVSSVSPFEVVMGSVVCSNRLKSEKTAPREYEEEYGPPTLTREQD